LRARSPRRAGGRDRTRWVRPATRKCGENLPLANPPQVLFRPCQLDTPLKSQVSSPHREFLTTERLRVWRQNCELRNAGALSPAFLATEERRAHCLQERRWLKLVELKTRRWRIGWRWWRRSAFDAMTALLEPRRSILYGVVGRNRKERGSRSGALNVRDVVRNFAYERIRTLALNDNLQVRRVPLFADDCDRLVIAHVTGRDGAGVSRAFGDDTVYRPRAERFLANVRAASMPSPTFARRI